MKPGEVFLQPKQQPEPAVLCTVEGFSIFSPNVPRVTIIKTIPGMVCPLCSIYSLHYGTVQKINKPWARLLSLYLQQTTETELSQPIRSQQGNSLIRTVCPLQEKKKCKLQLWSDITKLWTVARNLKCSNRSCVWVFVCID